MLGETNWVVHNRFLEIVPFEEMMYFLLGFAIFESSLQYALNRYYKVKPAQGVTLALQAVQQLCMSLIFWNTCQEVIDWANSLVLFAY